MLPGEFVEPAPQGLALNRLLAGRFPAALCPVVDPRRDALLDILRIGVQLDAALACQRLERADHRGQLHAIVGGMRLATAQLARAVAIFEQHTPAAHPRITLDRKSTRL